MYRKEREARTGNKAILVCIFLKLHDKSYLLNPEPHYAVKQS